MVCMPSGSQTTRDASDTGVPSRKPTQVADLRQSTDAISKRRVEVGQAVCVTLRARVAAIGLETGKGRQPGLVRTAVATDGVVLLHSRATNTAFPILYSVLLRPYVTACITQRILTSKNCAVKRARATASATHLSHYCKQKLSTCI